MRRRRILVVDDWEDSAITLAALLSASGYETSIATTGLRALDIAEAERPDAVLLDLNLPDQSGFDVCKSLRSKPWAESLLIVALTGWTRQSDRAAAKEAGFDFYIIKPATFDTLEALLQGIERRGGQPAA